MPEFQAEPDFSLILTLGSFEADAGYLSAIPSWKAASAEAVHIRYDEGVITVSFGSSIVFRMEVLEALKAHRDLTVKREGRILKLYDKDNNLLQEIEM